MAGQLCLFCQILTDNSVIFIQLTTAQYQAGKTGVGKEYCTNLPNGRHLL